MKIIFRAIKRERAARKEAEKLLEHKSRELFDVNQSLRKMAEGLEGMVAERTRQLSVALVETERAIQAKGEFLAMISHEIRTPLNGILGMAEMLGMSSLSAEQRLHLATVQRSGEDLLVLVNDVLDFSKIEDGKMVFEEIPFDPFAEFASVIELFAQQASSKGLELRLEKTGDLPSALIGDRTRLRQILANLVSNALKFTRTGGIVIRIAAAVKGPVADLQCEVADTGMGIPADKLDRLFKPFSQVDSSISRLFGGTGLGLAICARLCESMSGNIAVVSEPGVGSRFHFNVRLPLTERNPQVNLPTMAASMSRFDGARILIVEDVEANRLVIRSMLGRLGVDCEEALNGLQAVERSRASEPYHLILMDIQLPEMDGLEATQAIRSQELARGLSRVPIVALTAGVFVSDQEKCRSAGMDDVMAKPVKLQALVECLKRWLPKEQQTSK